MQLMHPFRFLRRPTVLAAATATALSGCAGPGRQMSLVEGPPITDIVTPFDEALSCLDGRIADQLTFAVGNIPDATGREQFNDGGSGKFVTQAAANIVQSSLFKTGVTLINRRDLSVPVQEGQIGVRTLQTQLPAHFYVTGTVTSLDFLPGGGAYLSVAGIGPRYRQARILIALDLAMTNSQNGQIVANIALNKQIVADEVGAGYGRIDGDTLIDADIAAARREALNFSLRQMLQLGTFELLTQLMPAEQYEECALFVDAAGASIAGLKTTGEQRRLALPDDTVQVGTANGIEDFDIPLPAVAEEERRGEAPET